MLAGQYPDGLKRLGRVERHFHRAEPGRDQRRAGLRRAVGRQSAQDGTISRGLALIVNPSGFRQRGVNTNQPAEGRVLARDADTRAAETRQCRGVQLRERRRRPMI